MADFNPLDFDTAAARADGIPDADIAAFLAGRAGFDLAAARRDGVSDEAIVDFLSPERAPEPVKKPEKAGIGDDLNRGWQRAVETVQTLRADMSAQRLSEIEAAKAKADAGEYLTPWEKKQVADYEQVSGETKAELAERLGSAAERREKAEKLPMSPGYKEFKEAEGIGGKLAALWKSPADVVTSIIAEGAVASAPSLGAAVAGGVGPGMVAAGGTAFMQSYAGKILELLGKRGIDIKNRDAVMEALSDPDIARDLRTDATLAALPQAAAGAASMAVAPITMAPARLAASPVKQQAVNIPAQAAAQGALAAAGEAGSQAAVGEELDSGKITEAFVGGASQGPVDVAAFAARRAIGLGRATPEEIAAPVMEAGTVDEAIAAARETVDRGELETTAALADEYGNRGEQDQAAVNRLFGGLNDGEVQRAADGAWFYRKSDGQEWQLQPWDGVQRDDTIPGALADAQRQHYEQQGVRVVYFENDPAIPFDGAVDPAQPNTIFLSNKPDRNAAQVGAHEIAHVFESTTLPDGTNLGDLLQQQVAAGITAEGRAYAEQLFGPTAPKRESFAEGPEGDSLHADAVTTHLFRELGAEIGGEAPKFQTFIPRVVDAVEARYGVDAAKDVLQKLMDGIRQAMTTLRQFFFQPEEGAEYGQPPTESQKWVTNLDQIHATLADIYAQRFGETAGLTDRPKTPEPQRLLPAPALVTPPPATAENVFRPDRYARPPEPAPVPIPDPATAPPATEAAPPAVPQGLGPGPGVGYVEARTRVEILQRWLGELDQERRAAAAVGPKARLLQQTEAAILRKVRGAESRLTNAARTRLDTVRQQLDALLNPEGDSPDMARVREQLQAERQRMANAAAVGTPSPSMLRAVEEPAAPTVEAPPPEGRGRVVMQEPPATQPPPATVQAPASPAEAPLDAAAPASAPQPAPAPAPTPAADMPNTFNDRLKAEKETVWADRSIMGRVQRGVVRNEQYAVDVARERLMREDAAPLVRRALEEDGIPDHAIPEIAKLYRQEDGEAVEAAFDRAVDRWVTKREAEGALIEQDLYEFDWLKSEGGGDPVLAEAFARIEEAYTGREREKPGDEDIPFGGDETGQAPARPGEAAARDEQAGGGQDRGGPRSRSGLAEEEGAALRLDAEDGPAFSPRLRPRAWVEFGRQVARALKGEVKSNLMLPLGHTPEALRVAGAPDRPLVMRASVATKVTVEKHAVDPTVLERLPDHLAKPVAIFESSTTDNALVALLDAKDTKGNYLVAAVHLADGSVSVNQVKSLYPKERDLWVREQVRAGRLRYVDTEKSRGLSADLVSEDNAPGVQFPRGDSLRGTASPGSARKVFTQADLVKDGRGPGGLSASEDKGPAFSPRQVETPEFRRWFGDSKAVDDNGKPLVVYHGSNRSFSVFRERESQRAGMFGPERVTSPAFFFTPDRDTARMFAEDRSLIDQRLNGKGPGRPAVRPFFLKVEQPLDFGRGAFPDPKVSDFVARIRGDEVGPETWQDVHRLLDDRETVETLKAEGYDGARLQEDDGAESWAVFDSRQIKSPNNNGTFDPESPNTLFSPRIRVTGDNPDRQYTPAQIKARENVRGTERRSLAETIGEWRQDFGRKLVREIFDPYIGLKDRDPRGYLAARMANSVTGAVDMFNTWGTLKFDGPVYATDKQTGGPVALIRDLGKEAHDFMDWVAANRAERLKAEDRENLFTAEDIAAMKALNKGTLDFDYTLAGGKATRSREAAYLDALKRYDTANKNAQDLAVAGGLLKREDVDALWDNPFYVPFYRQAEDGNSRGFVGGGTGGFTGKTAFKKLTGGTEKLTANLWQNAFGNWAHLIDASIRNKAANQVLEAALEDGIVEKVTAKRYDHELTKAQKENVVWTMVDGEKTYWQVDDPFTLKAVAALDYVQSSTPLMGIGRAAKRLLQTGVAASPIFQVRNLIRDTENAIAVSPIAKNVFRNLADGARQQDVTNGLMNVARAIGGQELGQARISKETADAVAGGATMRYAAGVDQSFRNADTYLDSETKIGKFWDYFRRLGQASTEAMGFGENMNRLALYRQLGEQGAPTELRAYEARDLSDFTLTGASPIIRHLVEVVPYMNAWMQGLYKVGRTAADADKNVTLAVGGKVAAQVTKRLAAVTMGMVALNLALDAIYADDEDYQNRNEYDRNSNFWFKVGKTEFRVPMGFEVAALSRMAAIWIETLYDKDMPASRAWKNTLSILGTQMAFNPIPQAVKPLVDLYGNETRMGAPIESLGMQRLRPEFRSAPGTTLVAKGLSEAANKGARAIAGPNARAFSPVQFDYLVQAYAGWLGTSSLQIADTVVRAMSNEPEMPARDLIGKYTGGLISNEPTSQRGSGRYVNMLYQQGDAIQEAYATYRDLVKRGRTEEAREYHEDNLDLIAKNRIYQRVIRTESQLNEQIRAITNHTTMTGEQKRVRIMVLQAAKNRAARALFAPEATP